MTFAAFGLRDPPWGYGPFVLQTLRAVVQTIRWAEPHAYESDDEDE